MKIHQITIAFIAALALSACSTTPTVPYAAPHGVIYTQYYHAADDTHPVAVIAIDGVNMRAPVPYDVGDDRDRFERLYYRLPPGKRRIQLMADLSASRRLFTQEQRRRMMPYIYEIEIEVEAGKEYMLAARQTGATLRDWEPVVVRVRDFR